MTTCREATAHAVQRAVARFTSATPSAAKLSAAHSDELAAYVETCGYSAPWQRLLQAVFVPLALWLLAGAAVAAAQVPDMTGTVHVLWGDPPAGPPVLQFLLSGDDGVSRVLDVEESVLAAAGGLLRVNGSRMHVQIDGAPAPNRRERVRALVGLSTGASSAIVAGSQAARSLATPSARARPYVTILCRFADSVDQLPGTKAHYEQLMGAAYPGVNHYWTEVTAGGITLDGGIVVGWYTLPEPRSAYVPAGSGADLMKLLDDCTAAADADVDYASFHGINMQFNQYLDCCSWGGGRTLTLDGVRRIWGTTWQASWAGLGTYAHEVGHSLGLPHSGGPYGNVYDSRYDVMSHSSWYRDPIFNFSMGGHTIGYHKDRLGAIPADRRIIAAAPLTRAALERSALPRANAGAQLVIIPVREETGEFYTVESRRGGGYDAPLAQAVVIHYVNPRRSEPAQLVDVDGNGNVADAGVQWVPGELFRDLRHDIAVLIDSVHDEQVHITVLRGKPQWLVLAPGTHAHRVPYGSTHLVQDSVVLQTSEGLAWQAATARRRAQVLNPAGVGAAVLRWQRQPRGLAPGVYVDTIRVLSPGASGHLAYVVDSLIVAEAESSDLSLSLSVTARADSVFQNATGYADSVMIRFAGEGSATAEWLVGKRRGSTILHSASSGIGNGTVRWYHWTSTLGPGVYVDTITVAAPGAAGSPITIIDTLHVHALPTFTVARYAAGRAIVAEGSSARDSVRIRPTGRWETAGTWTATYQGAASYIRLLDQRPFSGSVVLAVERRAEGRAPGIYVDTVRLAPTMPTTAFLLIDTMEVVPSPLTLQLSRSGGRDSVVADVTQQSDSVLVMAAGPGANTRYWVAAVNSTSGITLVRCDAATPAGRGRGTAWLRWFRNAGGRAPGLYIDTIRIAYADTALSLLLIDTLLVLPPLAATVSSPSRSTYMVAGGGSSRDSVQLTVLGRNSAAAEWTAQTGEAWLRLDATSGTGPAWLSWTRTPGALPAGTYVDTIRVAVAGAGGAAPIVVDTLQVVAPVAVAGDSLRPTVPVGRVYADTLSASGGSGEYTWTVVDGVLPPGLILTPGTGVITGQATTAAVAHVTVRATSVGLSATRAVRYDALMPPTMVTDSLRPPVVLHASYADTLRASGGDGVYRWSIATGELPVGLALDSSGAITGTPTETGSTRVLVRVTSAELATDVPLRITIGGAVVITAPAALREGRMGAAYADTLRASSDGAVWSVRAGSLPAGIALDATSGVISGVPEEAGEFTASICAAADGSEVAAVFQLSVRKPTVAESALLDQLLGGAALSGDDARFLDLLGNRNGRVDVGDVRAWLRDTGRLDASPATELQRIVRRLENAASSKEDRR